MTAPRYATQKQLEKIHHTVRHDWGLSENLKNLVWQKDLSRLTINQASRLIKYFLFHDETPSYISYAIKLLNILPDSPDFRRMQVLQATKNGGVYEDAEVTIQ